MNQTLTTLKSILARNDVKLMMVCILAGCISQLVAAEYLKRHPEMVMTEAERKLLFKELRKKRKKQTNKGDRLFPRKAKRFLHFRGGSINPLVAHLIKKLN